MTDDERKKDPEEELDQPYIVTTLHRYFKGVVNMR